MNFENNEEAGPSGIFVEKEIETNEAAGKRSFIMFHCLYYGKNLIKMLKCLHIHDIVIFS